MNTPTRQRPFPDTETALHREQNSSAATGPRPRWWRWRWLAAGAALALVLGACGGSDSPPEATAPAFDLLISGGTVHDGSGGEPFVADVAIRDGRIVAIGNDLGEAATVIDARGKAVAPGFINVLSWATESLIEDGRSLSDIRQGVTLEVFGEGFSMGPLNPALRDYLISRQNDIRYDVPWTTLGEYLEHLEERGVSPNVASFIGATTVRIHELGFEDRAPNPEELDRMRALVRQAMEEGALGVGASLIYAPAFYADTDELVALNEVAAEYGGRYIAHIRSEGNRFEEAVEELIEIARRAGIGAEIYHLKAAGQSNWHKLDKVIARIEQARADGLDISADMYTYTAGATGLDAAMPPWVQEGGLEAWVERMRDPAVRERLRSEISTPSNDWENLYLAAGGPENLLFFEFKNPDLKPLTGKTLAEVAAQRGTSPEDTMIDLVIEDGSRVGTVYFLMSEDNIRQKIALPWMSFGSDAESSAPEGVFLQSSTHPRAYGNFARLLGRYVRDEGIISLPEAIRRLTALPADNLGITGRGRLVEGHFADVVVFDPDTVADHATYENPLQLATGVTDVIVNGTPVLRNGEHTGATPGRVVRGPGWRSGE
ncbi:MAG: D-aminoacylase [Xanthomonadaceae bacterium]|nr:D-aminoacylase [Xanthomonadaceae bacterium]